MNSEFPLVAELARMTAFFQLRTIAMHMGADPDAVDPATLRLTVTTNTPRAEHPLGTSAGGSVPPFSAPASHVSSTRGVV